ncbi:hypothetical protein LT104_07515 [Lacticaseibacillus zeae]|nr:hypothetical protein [Lacticaseibacillus zeae]OFR91578.1 hypothetical protein HMPREF2861_12540 [Lactobacillus sp. HMSC068F07]
MAVQLIAKFIFRITKLIGHQFADSFPCIINLIISLYKFKSLFVSPLTSIEGPTKIKYSGSSGQKVPNAAAFIFNI